MKYHRLLAAAAVAGGCCAFVLRTMQNHIGFESTGLSIPGNGAARGLLIVLAVCAVLLTALSAKVRENPVFPEDFSRAPRGLYALPVAGSFLILLAGAADILEALGGGEMLRRFASPLSDTVLQTGGLTAAAQILSGALLILAGGGLLLSVFVCRDPGRAFSPTALLLPPIALVVRLVLIYRVYSVNPVLWAYAPEVLALVFLTLGFFDLSSFAFASGVLRRFSLYAGLAVVMSLCVLADGGSYLSAPFVYLGGALTLLGFTLLPSADSQSA